MSASIRTASAACSPSRVERSAPAPLLAIPAMLLVVAALLAGCGEPTPGATGPAPGAGQETSSRSSGATAVSLPPDTPVLLVSIDTLRSDRLAAYGYDGTRTPAIDRFAREAVLYERAYSHLSLTLPSHTTILTGLLPTEHGVRDNVGYPVPPDAPLLQRILGARGYATGAAISSFVLRSSTGIARGFDEYDDDIPVVSGVELGGLQRPGSETLQRALGWMEDHRDDRFFYLFHIYEPHSPYDPPEPYASRTADPYDGEVEEADAVIGGLIAGLERLGLWDRALVILLSDHGEGLGDHGEMEHEVLIYREMLQVPLLIKLPGGERGGSRIEEPVQLVDVAPTILAALGIERPATWRGQDLLAPGGPPPRPVFSESIYPRLHFGWSDLASIIDGRHHYIEGDYLGGADPELYDLVDDPLERENLAARHPDRVRALAAELDRFDRTIVPPAADDPAAQRQLLALGYVTSTTSAEVSEDRPRPDPKARIGVLGDLGRASRLFAGGRYLEAAASYRSVLEDEPQMAYGWEQLGKSLRRAERLDEAHAAFTRAFELSGHSPSVALSLAELELARGALDSAEAHARIAAPSLPTAWDLLAQVALRRGDLETAEQSLERALSEREGRVEPLVTLVELRVRQQRFEQALQEAELALREFGERTDREVLRGLEYQRGVALASLDRLEEAEQAFRAEIALSPNELAPYPRLALVLALSGRVAEVGPVLREMVTANPTATAYAEAVRTLRALGDESSAAALLRSALARWPNDPELRSLAG
ncbi:MAG TPA: sulfatase-like hydrolase/transferase [Thermoanaerobaculia bacterium]|nr:sulfatase-like hydrolase/transferase [Thermoanaerobaculia bacterium]